MRESVRIQILSLTPFSSPLEHIFLSFCFISRENILQLLWLSSSRLVSRPVDNVSVILEHNVLLLLLTCGGQ